jgi:hypothetical protein
VGWGYSHEWGKKGQADFHHGHAATPSPPVSANMVAGIVPEATPEHARLFDPRRGACVFAVVAIVQRE